MKNIFFLSILFVSIMLVGCASDHNFMDVDNSNAKEDLKYYIGSGNTPEIDFDGLVPDDLSGVRKNTKGQANEIYEKKLKGYVDVAKGGLSGAVQELKGYYNDGVDELNGVINEKVSGIISGELNKFKIR